MPDSGTPLEEITRTPDGQNPLIQTHVVKQAPINPDTGDYGEPVPVSHAEEEFADVGGLRRLIRRTAGSDLADGLQRTTRFGWVNAPENSAIHGLLQWQLNPDRSFVHHSYPTSTGETSGSIVTLTPWKGTTWTPTPPEFTPPDEDGCIVESTAYDGTSLAIQREVVNGKGLDRQRQLVSRETQEWTSTEDLMIHSRTIQYGAATTDVLTTTTAYSATDGRIAWRELPDGTAETYSYSGPVAQAGYTQTVAVGAGSRNGITSGTWTMTTRNQQGFATAVEIRHSATPNTLSFESWAGGQFDLFGRPGKRTWNAEVNDYDQTVFGCCGISSFRDRNGITEDYSRDYLKRLYKTVRTAGSNVVTTITSFSGLVTETKRKAGSDPVINVLVSKTTRLSNGEIDQVAGPDQDNLNVSTGEVASYSYSYPASGAEGGGHSVTVTHPGDGDETTTYLVDGRVAQVSGSAVADASYDYDVHSENGGGTVTIVTRPGAASSTGEWVKTYADLAGRPFRVEYPTQIALAGTLDHSATSYHPHNASAGSRGKVASTTDPDGVTVSHTYDPEGERYQTTETMPGTVGNRVTTTAHDVIADGMFGIRRTTTTVNGVTVSRVLVSDHGRTTRTILPDTDPNNDLNVASTTRSVISAAGAWTETSTHPDGTRIRQVFADGLLQSVERRDNTSAGSGLGVLISSTSHHYDALGRLWKTTDSRTGDTLYTNYTEAGNPGTVTAPGSRPTSYQYDQRGRVTQVNQPDTDITNPDGTITTGWPNVTHTSYYPTGEVKAVWGDQTYATFRVYDEQNRLTELRTFQTLAHGTEPIAGTLGAATTSWSYHPQRGWLTAKEYPDGQDEGPDRDPGPSYAYTAAGRLKSRTWGGGKHTRYDYRQGMLVARRHFTSATSDIGTNSGNDPATPDTGFAYNAFGQLQYTVSSATTDHPSIRWIYVYDVTYTLRRMRDLLFIDPDMTFTLGASDAGISLVSGPAPDSLIRNLYRSADPLGRHIGAYLRQNLLLTTGLEVGATLAYDAEDGRLATVTGDFVGSTASFSYGYVTNSNSDLIASVTSGTRTVTNQWETSRDILDFKENKDDSTLISKYDYLVNKIGQRTSVTASGSAFTTAPNWNWGYNPRGELTSSLHVNTAASSRYYAFDAIGNRSEHRDGTHTSSGGTPTSYTPNDLNQYNAVGALNPTYQLDGNMTAGPLPAAPAGNSSLVWNGENQLVEVTPYGGTAIRYHYDAFGRRIAKTVGTTRTYWFYDDWNPVAEYTGPVHTSGAAPAVTLNMTWLWGIDLSGTLQGAGGVGGLLAATIESGLQAGVYFPIFDGNGNVGQYLDASGVAVAKYEYDGFGRSFAPSGTHAALFPHRFSTKPLDSETGLYYYGYRWYDPVTGRWPSRDPIEEEGGTNLYGFVYNIPIDWFDDLGHKPRSWGRSKGTPNSRGGTKRLRYGGYKKPKAPNDGGGTTSTSEHEQGQKPPQPGITVGRGETYIEPDNPNSTAPTGGDRSGDCEFIEYWNKSVTFIGLGKARAHIFARCLCSCSAKCGLGYKDVVLQKVGHQDTPMVGGNPALENALPELDDVLDDAEDLWEAIERANNDLILATSHSDALGREACKHATCPEKWGKQPKPYLGW